uniref:Uncharacterized protein n=1 Tax=Glossina austeni TaxID=7395 RepID=A0A1A9VPB3_GLOAU
MAQRQHNRTLFPVATSGADCRKYKKAKNAELESTPPAGTTRGRARMPHHSSARTKPLAAVHNSPPGYNHGATLAIDSLPGYANEPIAANLRQPKCHANGKSRGSGAAKPNRLWRLPTKEFGAVSRSEAGSAGIRSLCRRSGTIEGARRTCVAIAAVLLELAGQGAEAQTSAARSIEYSDDDVVIVTPEVQPVFIRAMTVVERPRTTMKEEVSIGNIEPTVGLFSEDAPPSRLEIGDNAEWVPLEEDINNIGEKCSEIGEDKFSENEDILVTNENEFEPADTDGGEENIVNIGSVDHYRAESRKEHIDHRVDCFLFAEWYLMSYDTESTDVVPASFTIESSTNFTVDAVFVLDFLIH